MLTATPDLRERSEEQRSDQMPTYQYRCTQCATDLEAVQKFTDSALTECPSCEGTLRKVFNAVGVVFKGSGFYRTDSRATTNGNGSGAGTSKERDGEKSTQKTGGEKSPAASGKSKGSATSDSGSGSATTAQSSSRKSKETASAGSSSSTTSD